MFDKLKIKDRIMFIVYCTQERYYMRWFINAYDPEDDDDEDYEDDYDDEE